MAKVTGKATAKASADEGLTEDEILAYTILGEAGGEGATGMAAVMHVIQNRANSGEYPSSLSSVALQKSSKGTYQFTTWSKKYGNNPKGKYSKDSAAFKEALQIVQTVKAGAVKDPTGGALNYYANQGASGIAQPWWFNGEASGGSVQIGNHVFAAKSAIDPKITQGYKNELAAAMAGTAYPATMSPTTAQKRTASRINYLPASTQSLGLSGPANQRSTVKQAWGADIPQIKSVGSGLVSRKVTTVPINPLTGQPDTSANVSMAQAQLRAAITRAAGRPSGPTAAETLQAVHDKRESANPGTRPVSATAIGNQTTRAGIPPPTGVYPGSDAYKRWEAQVIQSGGVPQHIVNPAKPNDRQNVTVKTVRPDGTVVTSPKPGSVAMPDGARPALLPKMPVPGLRLPTASPTASPSASAPVTQNWTTKLVTKTVTVKNPKYVAVNPVAVNKLIDIHDKEDARIMAAQQSSLVPTEPEFITKQIVVEEKVPVLVKPKVVTQSQVAQPSAVPAQASSRNQYQTPEYKQTSAYKNAYNSSSGAIGGVSKYGRFYDTDRNEWVDTTKPIKPVSKPAESLLSANRFKN